MKRKKRAAIYARVSTSEQDPQMQLDTLREFAARRGLKVSEKFVDHGVSGTKEKRPALNKLMDGVRKSKFDVLLVYRFDRFARSLRHLVLTLDELNSLGISFISYSENIDTSSPMGRAMFQVMGAMAELERNLIVERCREGQRRAQARGVHIGRPRKKVRAKRVLALRNRGMSLRAIGEHLGVSSTVVSRVLKEAG